MLDGELAELFAEVVVVGLVEVVAVGRKKESSVLC